jgi:hypothetical protein
MYCSMFLSSKVWKFHLPHAFPIQNSTKQGDVLSSLIFKFALEYAIRKVQGNQKGMELSGKEISPCYILTMLLGENINLANKMHEKIKFTDR